MTAPQRLYTPAEYLAFEEAAERRHEYVDGEILAMTGTSTPHVIIRDNIYFAVRSRVGSGPCRPYGTDLRVRTPDSRYYTYPDLTIVCGRLEIDPGTAATLVNPAGLVEVLSDSTEGYDRGEKFARYRRIPSLREYVLVSQREARVERFAPGGGGGWVLTEAVGLDAVLELTSAGCALPLREVYDGVDLSAPPRRLRRLREPVPVPYAPA